MKYQRPEIRLDAEAIRAIESHRKPIGQHDNPDSNPLKTSPAYEADE